MSDTRETVSRSRYLGECNARRDIMSVEGGGVAGRNVEVVVSTDRMLRTAAQANACDAPAPQSKAADSPHQQTWKTPEAAQVPLSPSHLTFAGAVRIGISIICWFAFLDFSSSQHTLIDNYDTPIERTSQDSNVQSLLIVSFQTRTWNYSSCSLAAKHAETEDRQLPIST